MFVAIMADCHARLTPETPRKAHQGSKWTRAAKSSVGTDSIGRSVRIGAEMKSLRPSKWILSAKIRGGIPSPSITTKGTFQVGSTKGKMYFVTTSESPKAIRLPTIPRCEMVHSGFIVLLFVERLQALPSGLSGSGARRLCGLLQEVLHRMARPRFVAGEGAPPPA